MGSSELARGAWTAGAVARRLGIPPSTLRTWHHRYGVGPVQDRSGRHRLYSEADVAELESIQRVAAAGMPVKAAVEIVRRDLAVAAAASGGERAVPPPPVRSAKEVQRTGERLDHASLVRAFDAALAREGALRAWERLCRPALVRTGQRVLEQGDCTDVQLVLARAILASLHRMNRPVPHSTRPLVLLACLEGEHHNLVLEVLAAALAERGVHAACLGAAVADVSLLEAVTRLRPRVLVVSAQRAATARLGPLRAAREHVELILAGGPGWADRRMPPQVLRVDDVHRALRLTQDHLAGTPGLATSVNG
ncbi:MAG: MerR family transcriptional regulator [Sporichthyaceae bacterium]